MFLGDPQGWKKPPAHPQADASCARAPGGLSCTRPTWSTWPRRTTGSASRAARSSTSTPRPRPRSARIGLVVHGGHVNDGDDPRTAFDNWRKVFARQADEGGFPVPILIENTAGGDNAMARRLDALGPALGRGRRVRRRLLPGHLPRPRRRRGAGRRWSTGSRRSPAGSTWCTPTAPGTVRLGARPARQHRRRAHRPGRARGGLRGGGRAGAGGDPGARGRGRTSRSCASGCGVSPDGRGRRPTPDVAGDARASRGRAPGLAACCSRSSSLLTGLTCRRVRRTRRAAWARVRHSGRTPRTAQVRRTRSATPTSSSCGWAAASPSTSSRTCTGWSTTAAGRAGRRRGRVPGRHRRCSCGSPACSSHTDGEYLRGPRCCWRRSGC